MTPSTFVSIIFIALVTTVVHAQTSLQSTYRLGAGDKLNITVFNHADLSGEHTLDGAGNISVPLIGAVRAMGLTVIELEQVIVDRLKPDYLLNPRVSIQVLGFRPFYILGEVQNPDSYPYVDGMTYLNAVAIAGGFTYRAKKKHAMVIHTDGDSQEEVKVDINMQVRPGDIIRIQERLF